MCQNEQPKRESNAIYPAEGGGGGCAVEALLYTSRVPLVSTHRATVPSQDEEGCTVQPGFSAPCVQQEGCTV